MKSSKEFFIRDPRGLQACLEDIAASPRIGFDTEFVGEESYVPELCLIQVSTANALYVIDPYCFDTLTEFWKLIIDPERLIVVHAGREEIRLCRYAIDTAPSNLFDVQIAAALLGYGHSLGFSALNQSVIRKTVKKGETLTDWRQRPLTPDQLRYAFDDVRTLLAIWKRLDSQLIELNRRDWATEEFQSFVANAMREAGEVERWRKLKGISSMSAGKLAMIREVYRWRERVAARKNRPSRTIIRDDLLVEIVKKNPTNEQDLSTLRGLGRADLAEILEALDVARRLPPREWPLEAERDNDPQSITMITNLLNVVLSDWCSRNRISTPMAATSSEVRLLVRCVAAGEELPNDCMLNRGWRKSTILPMLREVLEGRRAIRIRSLSGDNPLEYGVVKR